MLAHHSGQLLNSSALGAQIGLTHVTTLKYGGIFEQLFLARLLPPWSANELKRLIKTPKLHFSTQANAQRWAADIGNPA